MTKIGDAVTYVDQYGHEHPALVTTLFDNGRPDEYPTPSANVLYVSDSESEVDQYGRQVKRETSVVNEANQSAHGRYWK